MSPYDLGGPPSWASIEQLDNGYVVAWTDLTKDGPEQRRTYCAALADVSKLLATAESKGRLVRDWSAKQRSVIFGGRHGPGLLPQ